MADLTNAAPQGANFQGQSGARGSDNRNIAIDSEQADDGTGDIINTLDSPDAHLEGSSRYTRLSSLRRSHRGHLTHPQPYTRPPRTDSAIRTINSTPSMNTGSTGSTAPPTHLNYDRLDIFPLVHPDPADQLTRLLGQEETSYTRADLLRYRLEPLRGEKKTVDLDKSVGEILSQVNSPSEGSETPVPCIAQGAWMKLAEGGNISYQAGLRGGFSTNEEGLCAFSLITFAFAINTCKKNAQDSLQTCHTGCTAACPRALRPSIQDDDSKRGISPSPMACCGMQVKL